MPSRHLTFQTILPACENGDAEAWRAFLKTYSPIVSRLLEVYVPQMEREVGAALWGEGLAALAAEDFKRLREFDHQAEREFLVDLKGFVLELATAHLIESGSGVRHTLESVRKRIDGRPIAHREIIFLRFGGYSETALAKVLVVPSTLVATALAPAAGADAAEAGAETADEPKAWLELLREVRAARTSDCPDRRIFVRILDGQISWYDKTPAENHMLKCIHCLDIWASLREADYLRRDTAPLPESEISRFLPGLPLAAATEARGSWFGKLLGR